MKPAAHKPISLKLSFTRHSDIGVIPTTWMNGSQIICALYLSWIIYLTVSIYFNSCFSNLEHRPSVKHFISQFLNLIYSVGLFGRMISLSQGRNIHTDTEKTQTFLSRVGFELTFRVFEPVKTSHALDRAPRWSDCVTIACMNQAMALTTGHWFLMRLHGSKGEKGKDYREDFTMKSLVIYTLHQS